MIVRSVVNRRAALNRSYNALHSERRERARAEERARVRAALARLPERQSLLLLRHAGLAYTEIAAIVDVAPGSVGTLLPARRMGLHG
jgi:RNA polymerase sigma-70 factor (ECF subfamily)